MISINSYVHQASKSITRISAHDPDRGDPYHSASQAPLPPPCHIQSPLAIYTACHHPVAQIACGLGRGRGGAWKETPPPPPRRSEVNAEFQVSSVVQDTLESQQGCSPQLHRTFTQVVRGSAAENLNSTRRAQKLQPTIIVPVRSNYSSDRCKSPPLTHRHVACEAMPEVMARGASLPPLLRRMARCRSTVLVEEGVAFKPRSPASCKST